MEDIIKRWKNQIQNMMEESSSSTRPWNNYAKIRKYAVLYSALAFALLILYYASFNNDGQFLSSLGRFSSFNRFNTSLSVDEPVHDEYYELRNLLKAASTKDNTVILTYLNEAWAASNSIFDIFLKSFKIGNNTAYLLNHMLVIAVDDDAYTRCQTLVSHCYLLKSNASSTLAHQANFMTPTYLDMVWRRLAFLKTILTLGYNFVITDTDVIWFRDPFPHFTPESDLQTSCDQFNGRQFDLNNFPNVGFLFARSNNHTIKFYEYWVSSRHNYSNLHEQDAFNRLKYEPSFKELGVKVRFLDTNYFSGFCSPSSDINKVCTMHANCCVGLDRKMADLNTALKKWKAYYSANHTAVSNQTAMSKPFHWSVPSKCLHSFTAG